MTAEVGASDFQYVAPNVFGIISDKIRINKVKITDAIPRYALPKTLATSAPTPAAPAVCATVFNDRIAASDRSTSAFNDFSNSPPRAFSRTITCMCPSVTERITASSVEHKKEKNSAKKRNPARGIRSEGPE